MNYATRTISAAILISITWSANPSTGSTVEPTFVVNANATAEQAAFVAWGVDRFAQAGMELPSFTITFHDDDGCGDGNGSGNLARYNTITHHLDFCNWGQVDITPTEITSTNTLLHELTHAWSFHVLTEAERQAFADQRGLEKWSDSDTAWWLTAQEQAAKIGAWGLMDEPTHNKWVFDEECASLAASFIALTGTEPLNQSLEHCES